MSKNKRNVKAVFSRLILPFSNVILFAFITLISASFVFAVVDITISTSDPSVVDPSFTPQIGSELSRLSTAYIGRDITYTGPAIGLADPDNGVPYDTIKWKVTIEGPPGIDPSMVDMDEVGFLDPPSEVPNLATYHYPFNNYVWNADETVIIAIVALGSCDISEEDPEAPLHDNLCVTNIGFSLDENDIFTNADQIRLNSNALVGNYNVTYELVDTATDTILSNPYQVSFTVSASIVTLNVNNADVCDDITGSPYYCSIQAAIDSTVEGDIITINVAAGTYSESITIDKSLTLTGDVGNEDAGADGNAPLIINGDCWRVVSVEANDVVIQGFNLDGDGCGYPVIRVDQGVSNATIQDNTIFNNRKGVDLSPYSRDNIILNNIIHDNTDYGIWIGGSTYNTISSNELYANDYGLGLGEGGCSNECVGNIDGNAIISNNIHDNLYDGIYFSYGDSITFTNLNLSNNIISNNEDVGLRFEQIVDSTDWLIISNNEIIDNGNEGVWIDYITNSNVNISENHITGNGRLNGDYYGEIYGIYIYSADENSQVKIDSNNISENSGPGIYLDQGDGSGVTNVDIINNDLVNNNKFEYTYWDIEPAAIIILSALGNKAHLNRIIINVDEVAFDAENNYSYNVALNNEDITNTFDAENNYWGSASPAFDSIIFGDVSYAPWYTDAALTMLISTQIEENETLADDEQEIIDENVTQVRVPIGSPIEELIVDSDNQVNISLAELIDLAGDVELVNDFILIRQTSTANYTAEISAGTIISGGSDWDGKINMPTLMDVASYSAPSGTADVVIDVGSGSELNFSNPIKITIGGNAGKKAAWARGTSILTEITTVCDSSTNPTNINAVSPRECYIDSGSDLIIWTYHFTQFAAYTPSVPSSTESSGGGGGGNSENLENLGPGHVTPEVIPQEEPETPEEETEEETSPVSISTVPTAPAPTGFAALTGNVISAITTPGGAIVAIVGVILVALALYSGYSYLHKKKKEN